MRKKSIIAAALSGILLIQVAVIGMAPVSVKAETKVAAEMTITSETNPTEEATSSAQTKPTEEVTSASQTKPAEEATSSAQAKPTEEVTSASQTKPTEEVTTTEAATVEATTKPQETLDPVAYESTYTGMKCIDGKWLYYVNGEVDNNYTGMAENEYGWWYFINGQLDWTYTGMAENSYGWWYYEGGRLNWTYTGMAENSYGWWYYEGGRLNWTYTGMAENSYSWWYFKDGRIDWHYTGWAENVYGQWHFTDGKIDWNFGAGIACWGDSMTWGQYGFGVTYPSTLASLTNMDVYNLGVSGETSVQIAMRAGGISMYTGEDIVINKGFGTDFTLLSEYDNKEAYIDPNHNGFGDYSGYNWENGEKNLCYINGQPFYIEYNGDTHHIYDKFGAFADDGNDKIYIPAGTKVYTQAAVQRKNDILILEIGSNGGWHNNYNELIEQYKSIIEYCGADKYLILGDTDDPEENADANQGPLGYGNGNNDTLWESALRNAFGEHFFNTRTYLMACGLSDNGLSWTDADGDNYDNGKISKQLRTEFDNTHMNAYGYRSKGIGVYSYGKDLGYWQ